MSEITNDTKIKSEAHSLATYELGSYKFILNLVIWYDILEQVNMLSKSLQSVSTNLQISTRMLNSLLDFLKKHTKNQNGLESVKIIAHAIAKNINIEPIFTLERFRKRKKLFDYENNDNSCNNDGEEIFKRDYFCVILNQTIMSMEKRLIQFTWY